MSGPGPEGQGSEGAIAHYIAHAGALRDRYEGFDAAEYHAPVRHLIPPAPCRTADIGTATGRDARWFADLGHQVTAVDPVPAFLEPARRSDSRVTWAIDALPDLPELAARGQVFDLLHLSAVWHHLAPGERGRAVTALSRLVAPGGLVLLALRQGPVPPGLPLHATDPDDTAAGFARAGLTEIHRGPAPTLQQVDRDAGVTWTWLALRAERNTP